MLRPRATRWFEVLAARDDATLVLEALARTGAVELEARGGGDAPAAALSRVLGEIAPLLAQIAELSARYQAYWPAPADCRPSDFPEPPRSALQRSLATIRAWAQDAEPPIRALQRNAAESRELDLWEPLLQALAARAVDPALLAQAGPWLSVKLFVLPPGAAVEQAVPAGAAAAGLLVSAHAGADGAPQLLAAGTPTALQAMALAVQALHGSAHDLPAWLRSDAAANRQHVADRSACIADDDAAHRRTLAELQRRHGLARALGDAHRLQWLLHNVHGLEAGDLLCWVTGWTADESGRSLQCALAASGARALLHAGAPPPGAQAPLLLSNPPWARPFEVFSRALGMPAAAEADPSALLAIAVPLMFGYMFGDIGQGLVIAAAAWWLRDRLPVARLLMAGGLSAAVFGLVFGSVFSLHGLLPALWLHPLDAPLPVLVVPLAGGAALLTVGLALDALAAWWRHGFGRWLATDAALVVAYLALLAAPLAPRGLVVAAAALAWFCIGHGVAAGRAGVGFAAAGEAVEKTLQILINTLSFARVGAFALAHAGLSSAVVALVQAADGAAAQAVVFVAGNAVVIVLEAMVVSIQTTRLVLFEFFTRFMQGRGRAFRPLPPPPYTLQETGT